MQDQELKAFAFACIDRLNGTGISRFSLTNGDFSLTIEQGNTAGASVSVSDMRTETEPRQEAAAAEGTVVPAPLVGTFYASDAPDCPPLVQPGDKVKKGDTLCIIEAMKNMNSIESPCDGTVRRVLAADGEPVEYSQPLFVIEE